LCESGAWTKADIGDQTNRIIFITGGNVGLGFASARHFATNHARVIIGCRSAKRAAAAKKKLDKSASTPVEIEEIDLSDLASVAKCAERVLAKYKRLDVLMLNAGIMNPPGFALTKDGFEQIFATNVVGHFALTLPLLPLLMSTDDSRVVSVSSFLAQESNGRFDNALRCDVRPYNSWQAYSASKLANLLFARSLAQKLESAGKKQPLVVASHPGITASNLQRHVCCLATCCGMSIDKGALTQMRAAVDPTADSMDYYGPRSDVVGYPVLVRMPGPALKEENAVALWELLEGATTLHITDYLPAKKRNKRRVRKLKEIAQ